MDHHATEAGLRHRLLASTNVLGNQVGGKSWVKLNGVTLPLVETILLHRMWRNPPAVFTGDTGILDTNGNALITLTLPPGAAASEIGRTFRLAAVSITNGGQASASSAAVLLTIKP